VLLACWTRGPHRDCRPSRSPLSATVMALPRWMCWRWRRGLSTNDSSLNRHPGVLRQLPPRGDHRLRIRVRHRLESARGLGNALGRCLRARLDLDSPARKRGRRNSGVAIRSPVSPNRAGRRDRTLPVLRW